MASTHTLVILPTYCEAGTVTAVLDRVLSAAPTADVLVVDDGSPDGTADLVRDHPAFASRVLLLSDGPKSGLGAAYRRGYERALAAGYDVVVQMDADLSHAPEDIPRLVRGLEDADLAIGSRYVAGGRTRGWAASRRWISRLGNLYVRLVLGLPVRDATAGFRAFRSSTLTTIDVTHSRSDGYAFQIETTWLACQHGLRVREVPITFTERAAGTSKMSARIAGEAVVNVLAWRLRGTRPYDAQPPIRRTADRPGHHARRHAA